MSSANPLTIQKRQLTSLSPRLAPLYLVHDGSGTIANYTKLQSLDCDVYGIQDPRLATSQTWSGGIVEMAKHYVSLLQRTTPNGSVVLGGWSFGGLVAIQMAYELRNHPAVKVQGLILMEVIYPAVPQPIDDGSTWPGLNEIRSPAVRQKVTKSIMQSGVMMNAWTPPTWGTRITPCPIPSLAPAVLPKVVLLRAKGDEPSDNPHGLRFNELRKPKLLGWEDYRGDFITECFEIAGSHLTLFEKEHIPSLTATMKLAIERLHQG